MVEQEDREEMRESKKLQANYTIEAALVFPIIFFVILFMLNYTFYCYDRAKLQAQLNDAMRRSAALMSYEIDLLDSAVNRISLASKDFLWVLLGDRHPKEQLIQEYCVNELDKGMYITRLEQISVESSYTELIIRGTATVQVIGLDWLSGFADYPFEIKMGQSENTFPREERARIIEAMIELGTNIKGVESIIEKVRNLVQKVH